MSVPSTAALHVAPPATDATPTTLSVTPWAYSPWTAYLASAPAGTALAGVALQSDPTSTGGGFPNTWFDLVFGVGAAGAEVAVGTFNLYWSRANNAPSIVFLPVPITIPVGARVAIRARVDTVGGGILPASLLYYTGLDSDQQTTNILTSAPSDSSGAGGAALTPAGVAWTNSAWVQLSPGITLPMLIAGVTHQQSTSSATVEFEVDLASGLPGAEVLLTTLRSSSHGVNVGRPRYQPLPALYPLAPSTPVSARLRQSGTSTLAWRFALIYYGDTESPPPPPPLPPACPVALVVPGTSLPVTCTVPVLP
jgi:hypothetical protein